MHKKWVYQLKEENNDTKRYKARIVMTGFQQREGINFYEIFSLIVNLITIRFIQSIMAAEDLHLEYLDIKTAFLHDDLEVDIYMM